MIKVENRAFRPRLPDFLKQEIPHGPEFQNVQSAIQKYNLNTVCEEAKCPNRTHCYARGTLTFQILGNVCTRACGFCAETFGKPGGEWDASEAERLVQAAAGLSLKHAVITSPARDDLPDQGANAFAKTVRTFRAKLPGVTVELLTPDFQGRADLLAIVFGAKPDIFNHNIETVRRLTPKVRSKATYERTLSVLKKSRQAGLVAKSGFMVGHGETKDEIFETLEDLIKAGCQMATIGQYLPPSPRHLPLQKIYDVREFDMMKRKALQMGFQDVASGPLVRSSYHAEDSAFM